MLDRSLVFVDLETTGAAPHFDRITEVGVVEVEHGRPVGEWTSLVNPERPIPQTIESLTGITDAMVANAPTFAELAEDLHRRLRGKTLVAHNARFDSGFLKSEFRRVGLRYEPDVLCTVRLSRRLFPHEKRHNLDSLIERHGLSCDARHRALADARVLWDFTQCIHREFDSERISQAVAEMLKKPQLPPGLPVDLFDRLPEAPGVYAFMDAQGHALHVGKTMNLRARMLSHFSGERSGAAVRKFGDIAGIDWKESAGELGMQIRFVEWVRRLQPSHNRIPRRDQDAWALQWDPVDGPARPVAIDLAGIEPQEASKLHGVFRSQRVALNALRRLADEHGLCHIGSGLQAGSGPCLGFQLKTCRGLCVGRESALSHSMRLMQALHALRIRDWPHAGPIGIRERNLVSGRVEIHVIDNWRYLGSVTSESELHELAHSRTDAAFDAGFYRLLSQYLKRAPRDLDIIVASRLVNGAVESPPAHC
ncbi:MAG TPA: exonuclease domain-containing protein [Burkholderiales bacterium]|nr:exonuclease domain-containing protein [Burkholderiales bacterium]